MICEELDPYVEGRQISHQLVHVYSWLWPWLVGCGGVDDTGSHCLPGALLWVGLSQNWLVLGRP